MSIEYSVQEMIKWGFQSLRSRFHRRFIYDFETGKLFYRYSVSRNIKPGDEVGFENHGYLRTEFNGKIYFNHRIIMIMFSDNFDDSLFVDHINGDKLDNRLHNLRMVSHQENMKNRKKHKNNTSGEMGISWYKNYKKWLVQIWVDGKKLMEVII